ncbi:MAG TPA: single-stranded-DNA-specific exonuclease RecJ [Lachnospiraceae bacterium]|nr:single-stranded-DNA-specific exonuclease RecJ [Lachnospiraceae bacterium]
MEQWIVTSKKADFKGIGEKYQIDQVTARIMRNRGLIEEREISTFLYGTLDDLHNEETLKDIQKGTGIVKEKIDQKKKIRIIGDYDIDGVCSTYILRKGLLQLGANVDAVIPHRMKDGYGINETLIKEAHREGVDTIITCDNGIAALSQTLYGKSLGMTIIITDHHEVPYEEDATLQRNYVVPEADAVIDPKQLDCSYPFKGICGGVVAFKFIKALYSLCHYENREVWEELLEFAAFATVGDVMELVDENRILVKYGLKFMKNTKNLGLKALISVTGLEGKELSPYHIGFVLGPCMNATGRLDTAERALQLLSATNWEDAVKIAGDLKGLNDSRKDLTAKGLEKAIALVEETDLKEDKVLVIYLQDCHESLAGIIAGRIREKYGKPAFVLTMGEDCVKGSGRSIDAFHMFEEMIKCKELFVKYGGHKLAAGLSIKEENISLFRKTINKNCELVAEDFMKKIYIDIAMPPSYISEKLIREFSLLEPFGMGNQKPVFAYRNLRFLSGKVIGKNKNVGKYTVEDEDKNRFSLIYFGDLSQFDAYVLEKFGKEEQTALYDGKKNKVVLHIIYVPEVNEFRGNKEIQLIMQSYR